MLAPNKVTLKHSPTNGLSATFDLTRIVDAQIVDVRYDHSELSVTTEPKSANTDVITIRPAKSPFLGDFWQTVEFQVALADGKSSTHVVDVDSTGR